LATLLMSASLATTTRPASQPIPARPSRRISTSGSPMA
jgi:hypothetical protein